MEEFRITQIYADGNGESHFRDIMVILASAGPISFLSEPVEVENMIFRKVLPSYDYDFHTAPTSLLKLNLFLKNFFG